MSTSTRPVKGTPFTTESGSEWRVTSVRKAWDGQLHVYGTPAFAYVDGGSNKALSSWTLDEWNALHATPAVEPVQDEPAAEQTPATVQQVAATARAAAPCAMQVFEWSTMNVRRKAGLDIEVNVLADSPEQVVAVAAALRPYGAVTVDGNSVLLQRSGHATIEQAHTEALAEDAAHDAATVSAMPMDAYLASLDLGMPRRLPQTLRTMAGAQRYLSLVPPRPAL